MTVQELGKLMELKLLEPYDVVSFRGGRIRRISKILVICQEICRIYYSIFLEWRMGSSLRNHMKK